MYNFYYSMQIIIKAKILFFFEKIYKIYTIIKIFIFLPLVEGDVWKTEGVKKNICKIYKKYYKKNLV